MTAMGMPGVSTWNFGEAFAHLYLDSVAMNHNSIGRGYETWGNGTAETMMRTVRRHAESMEWYRPLPPPAEVVVVGSRQSQLSGDRRSRALDYSAGQREDDAAQLLQERLGLLAEGPERTSLRFPDSRPARRSRPRCANGRTPARPAHRSQPRSISP